MPLYVASPAPACLAFRGIAKGTHASKLHQTIVQLTKYLLAINLEQ